MQGPRGPGSISSSISIGFGPLRWLFFFFFSLGCFGESPYKLYWGIPLNFPPKKPAIKNFQSPFFWFLAIRKLLCASPKNPLLAFAPPLDPESHLCSELFRRKLQSVTPATSTRIQNLPPPSPQVGKNAGLYNACAALRLAPAVGIPGASSVRAGSVPRELAAVLPSTARHLGATTGDLQRVRDETVRGQERDGGVPRPRRHRPTRARPVRRARPRRQRRQARGHHPVRPVPGPALHLRRQYRLHPSARRG